MGGHRWGHGGDDTQMGHKGRRGDTDDIGGTKGDTGGDMGTDGDTGDILEVTWRCMGGQEHWR